VTGYISLAQNLQKLRLAGESFNFSNEFPIAVIELVKKIYETANRKPEYKILDQAKYEIRYQYLSSQKARRILGWRPKYTLEEGLKKTIAWYKDYFNSR
jgi:CDP-glucose 4,6-dehydratase